MDVVDDVVLLVDDTLVSTQSSPTVVGVASFVVVVTDPARRPVHRTDSDRGSEQSDEHERRDRTTVTGTAAAMMTAPASTASAPTTTSVPTDPPEIGRSQVWESMGSSAVGGTGGCGHSSGISAPVPGEILQRGYGALR